MGGTDLRAEKNGPQEVAVEKKPPNSLEKLFALRQALINVGVSGEVFDACQDRIKRLHEDKEGKMIWDKVCVEMSSIFQNALKQ